MSLESLRSIDRTKVLKLSQITTQVRGRTVVSPTTREYWVPTDYSITGVAALLLNVVDFCLSTILAIGPRWTPISSNTNWIFLTLVSKNIIQVELSAYKWEVYVNVSVIEVGHQPVSTTYKAHCVKRALDILFIQVKKILSDGDGIVRTYFNYEWDLIGNEWMNFLHE